MTSSPSQEIPKNLLVAEEYESFAQARLASDIFAYIAGGSGSEFTLRANRQAFQSLMLQQRVLVDCRQGNTTCEFLGQSFRHPIFLAPVAFQTLVHPEGELASARAAQALEAGMICSTLSSFSLEEIAQHHPDGLWFQLYFQAERAQTRDLLQRAERAGYRALVVTLDTPLQAGSLRARRAGFTMPSSVVATNLARYSVPPQVTLMPEQSVIFQGMMNEAPTWGDLEWLLAETRLPVIAKGVTHAEDAKRLAAMGVSAMVVSNHGGRALDGMPASLQSLRCVRDALGAGYPIFLDGGIRSGSDIFKALASGANAVLIGRSFLYALAVAGPLGVAHVIKLMREELELCMALAGCPTLSDISLDALYLP
ncbi:FMN-dependent alpha-hydroxy acid dehydrogenase [gamma proteobacterium HdN1]|nr:FMN-dependent alpha-hydroxy acid dehydrogenase [gamma proteobacterium HdN1]